MEKFDVSILIGSDSDYSVIEEAITILERFNVKYKLTVTSAHRTPERTDEWIKFSEEHGAKVFIVGAGSAAHLAGVVASKTVLPVIGVPISSTSLNGIDALFSTVQMPGGVPVATMAIGKAGAKNAGILAVQILAISDPELKIKLNSFKKEMKDSVEAKAKRLSIKNQNIIFDF